MDNYVKGEVVFILRPIRDIFKKDRVVDFRYRIALDIGTEYVKAIIVRFDENNSSIIGYGKVKQKYVNMEGGAISNIEDVIKVCYEAIERAKEVAEVSPKEIVIGIAGEFVKGTITSLTEQRPFPKRKLRKKEIDYLVKKAQVEALSKVKDELLADMGLDDLRVELVNSSIVEMKVDGYKVSNAEDFQGKNLEISVFNTFAPLVHVGALETIALRLGYNLVGIIAEPFSIAKSIMSNEAYEFGAIVVDIGGGTSDIALIRNGGIEGTKMFAMAGRDFTKSIARGLNLSLEEAEDMKLSYSEDSMGDSAGDIKSLLKEDLNLLYEGIEMALNKLAKEEALPQRLYLCGGGSALTGLFDGMVQRELYESLPFFKRPEIRLLVAEDVKGINDNRGFLVGAESVTPKSLALQATRIKESREENLWDKLISNFS